MIRTWNRSKSVFYACCLMIGLMMSNCGDGAIDNNHRLMRYLPSQVDPWVRSDSTEVYDRESIFEYINGAGEVYNSYAFSEVLVTRFKGGGDGELTVEIFDMGNQDDAYGVFSYAHESEETGIGGGYEQRGRVLCFWQNKFYVCVSASDKTDNRETAVQSLAKAVSENLPHASNRPALVDSLPVAGRIPHSERYFHVQATLNYNYYLARKNLLNLDKNTNAVLARYVPGSTYLLIIEYQSADMAKVAHQSFRSSYLSDGGDTEIVETAPGKFTASKRIGRHVVLILDAPTLSDAKSLLTEVNLDV